MAWWCQHVTSPMQQRESEFQWNKALGLASDLTWGAWAGAGGGILFFFITLEPKVEVLKNYAP